MEIVDTKGEMDANNGITGQRVLFVAFLAPDAERKANTLKSMVARTYQVGNWFGFELKENNVNIWSV